MRGNIITGLVFLLVIVIAVEITYLFSKPEKKMNPMVFIRRAFDCQNSTFADPTQHSYVYNRDMLCFMMGTRTTGHISTEIQQTFEGTIHKMTKGVNEKNELLYLIYLTTDGQTNEAEMNSFLITAQMQKIGTIRNEPFDIKKLKAGDKIRITQHIDLTKPIETSTKAFEIEPIL